MMISRPWMREEQKKSPKHDISDSSCKNYEYFQRNHSFQYVRLSMQTYAGVFIPYCPLSVDSKATVTLFTLPNDSKLTSVQVVQI